jgi:Disulphide bond corrector protein DsbC
MASNNSYRILRTAALPALLCALSVAQDNGHLKVGQPSKAVGKRSAEVQVRIPVSVDKGFHVNSNTPAEDYLIPLKLVWNPGGGLIGGDVTYPKPTLEKYEFSEKPLSIFSGDFHLVVNFQVAPDAPAGPGVKVGKLRYQACDNKACYPPKTVEVSVPYQVQ